MPAQIHKAALHVIAGCGSDCQLVLYTFHLYKTSKLPVWLLSEEYKQYCHRLHTETLSYSSVRPHTGVNIPDEESARQCLQQRIARPLAMWSRLSARGALRYFSQATFAATRPTSRELESTSWRLRVVPEVGAALADYPDQQREHSCWRESVVTRFGRPERASKYTQ